MSQAVGRKAIAARGPLLALLVVFQASALRAPTARWHAVRWAALAGAPERRLAALEAKKGKFKVSDWATSAGDSVVVGDGSGKTEVQAREQPRVQAAVSSSAKPVQQLHLFVKAGPDGESVGDCPFAHSVRMVLEAKGLEYVLSPCAPDGKPQWLVDGYDGKMPCLVHDGEAYTESSHIVDYLNFFFQEPKLAAPMAAAQEATSQFFPALAKYLKNTDESADPDLREALETELTKIDMHLQDLQAQHDTEDLFIAGPTFGISDCALAPKLYHMDVAAKHFKNFQIPTECKALEKYLAKVFAHPAFAKTQYPEDVVLWGWGNARGGE